MNCENLTDRLPEYLDETLPAAEQAAARGHVQACLSCQRALAREEVFAKSIRLSFNRETEGLSLRPDVRQNILNALQQPEPSPSLWEYIQFLWRQPAWGGAILFCLLFLGVGGLFHFHSAKPSRAPASICVIDVPIQTETYVYRRQNNLVVDAVVTGVSVMDARLIN